MAGAARGIWSTYRGFHQPLEPTRPVAGVVRRAWRRRWAPLLGMVDSVKAHRSASGVEGEYGQGYRPLARRTHDQNPCPLRRPGPSLRPAPDRRLGPTTSRERGRCLPLSRLRVA